MRKLERRVQLLHPYLPSGSALSDLFSRTLFKSLFRSDPLCPKYFLALFNILYYLLGSAASEDIFPHFIPSLPLPHRHWKHIKIIHCGIFSKYRDNIPQKIKIKSDKIYRKYFDGRLKHFIVDYFDNILCNILIQKTVDCQFIFKIFTLYSQVVYFDIQPCSAMQMHQNKFKIVYHIL